MKDYDSQRIGLYRKIEVARKQLPSFGEEEFRTLLRNRFAVTSRRSLTLRQLSMLVDILADMGATFTTDVKKPGKKMRAWIEIRNSMPFARERRQILAIWRKLGYAMDSLDTRVKRAFGVETFLQLEDPDNIRTLLCDLQRREKALEKAGNGRGQGGAGATA